MLYTQYCGFPVQVCKTGPMQNSGLTNELTVKWQKQANRQSEVGQRAVNTANTVIRSHYKSHDKV